MRKICSVQLNAVLRRAKWVGGASTKKPNLSQVVMAERSGSFSDDDPLFRTQASFGFHFFVDA